MKTIHVGIAPGPSASDRRHYALYVGSGLLDRLGDAIAFDEYSSVFALTDENVGPHWASRLDGVPGLREVITMPAGEGAKELENVRAVWSALTAAGADRRALLLNLGGGVVGDLGGFAAATFLRGIAFAQLPTTLLAQVDASVGGKVGVNLEGRKNQIGAFAQPIAVVADVDTLATLDERTYRAGFAEMLKHGLIRDRGVFESLDPALVERAHHLELVDRIADACEIKRAIVEADVRETGERKRLNFGHTVGHAVETVALREGARGSGDGPGSLLHGEAVAIGMVAECRLSGLRAADVDAIETKIAAFGLPIRIPAWLDFDAILAAMQSDKKRVAGRIGWTLLDAIGRSRIEVALDDAPVQDVLRSMVAS